MLERLFAFKEKQEIIKLSDFHNEFGFVIFELEYNNTKNKNNDTKKEDDPSVSISNNHELQSQNNVSQHVIISWQRYH